MKDVHKIPQTWECVKLGEITKNISIKNSDKKISHVVSVTKSKGIVDSLDFFKKQVYSKELATYKVIKRNQFAYATIHLDEGSIGYLADHKEAVLSPMYTVFEAKTSRVNLKFLFSVLKSEQLLNVYNHIGSGSVNRRKAVPYSIFSKIEIALPPLPEQQKIAEILSTVDEKIAVIDEQLAKTTELKTGLMQRLLTKGIGHTEFKDSPLGEIPKGWEMVRIKDIGEVKGGKRLPKGEELVNYNTGFPYIKAGDLKKGTVITTKLEYLTPEIQKKIKNYTISSNDTYITIVGAYIGDVGVIPKFLDGSNLTENAAKIHSLKGVSNKYLAYYLASEFGKVQIQAAIGAGAQPKLALMRIQEFLFPKPDQLEQKKILDILITIDEKVQVLRDKKAYYQTLKRGLMQQLLTGKLRVRVAQDAVPA